MTRPRAPGPGDAPGRHLMLRLVRRAELLVGGAAILTAILILVGLVVAGAVLFYFLERGADPRHVHSIASGFEWVALTLCPSRTG